MCALTHFLLPRKGSYIYLRTFARAQHVVCVFPGSPALVDLIRKGPPEMRPSGGEMLLAVQFGVVIVCVCALLAKCACVSACVFVCVHANTGFYYCALFFLRRDLAIYAFFFGNYDHGDRERLVQWGAGECRSESSVTPKPNT